MKQCSQCKCKLPLEAFVKDKYSPDGYTAQCKDCRNAKKKEYREKSKSKIKAYWAQYYNQFRERNNMKRKQYFEQHKEQISLIRVLCLILSNKRKKQYNQRYNSLNRSGLNERARQHYSLHRETMRKCKRDRYKSSQDVQMYHRIKKQRRKALAMGLVADFTKEDWHELLAYFNYQCAYCGSTSDITQEHVIPASKGGHYTRENIIPACSICNDSKRDKSLDDWYAAQPFFDADRLTRIVGWCNGHIMPVVC